VNGRNLDAVAVSSTAGAIPPLATGSGHRGGSGDFDAVAIPPLRQLFRHVARDRSVPVVSRRLVAKT